ncbi:MAG: hypothetical protein JO252_11800, partial [Planctomycetaceae bacterium]|nr:hypothetical protein [Planctomycetaceae bacterium]
NLDRAGDSYSADALGTTVTWGGAAFDIGAATANNVVQMGGVPISLPQGNYSSIKLLGTGTYGVQPGTFIVHYTDGTTDSFTQAFSDWRGGYTGAGTTAPGESIAVTMTHFNTASGRVNQTVYLYGYSFPLDPRKTVSYMEVPNNNDIKILAIDELYQHLSG